MKVWGKVYRVQIARFARRKYPWCWETFQAGVRKGSNEKTFEDARAGATEPVEELLERVLSARGRRSPVTAAARCTRT